MMNELVIRSHAKVNLTLDVLGRRPSDGYHYVKLVMVPVELHDTVTLRPASNLSVVCEPDIAGPIQENLAYRAAQLLREETGYTGGAFIHINKSIPVAGGMAGGSTNGAAVLSGLNRLWGLGLSTAKLIDLAIQLGSDVPFFVEGRPARVEGIGEVLTPLPAARRIPLVIATPDVAKSTGSVFRWFDELHQVDRPDTQAMERALAGGDLREVAAALGNVFEPVMLPRHPEIVALKRAMMEGGALGALMSGAGPTVFGIVPDETVGRSLAERLRPIAKHVFFTYTAV